MLFLITGASGSGKTACLLDCYDVERIARLRRNGSHGATQDMRK